MKIYHLKFNKEQDRSWYIDLPHYPFSHANLMMVAGANLLCEYAANKEGLPDYALVDVTTGEHFIDGKDPDVIMLRIKKKYGATYSVTTPSGVPPILVHDEGERPIHKAWICPVTLLVLHSYPQRINLYLRNE